MAIQLTLVTAQTLLFTASLQALSNVVSSRERPFGEHCGGSLPSDTRMCDSPNRYRSFFSGHTSQAFASAAVTCVHHAELPLYGGGPAEWVPCAAGFAMAAATGVLRIVGDQHYATDVLTGAAVGTLSGFLVPWLFYYNQGDAPRDRKSALAPRLLVAPAPLGVSALGSF